MSVAEKLRAASSSLRKEQVEVNAGGEALTVEIREITYQVMEDVRSMYERVTDGTDPDGERFALDVLSLCAFDPETGERVWTRDDAARLASEGAPRWIEELIAHALIVNGFVQAKMEITADEQAEASTTDAKPKPKTGLKKSAASAPKTTAKGSRTAKRSTSSRKKPASSPGK